MMTERKSLKEDWKIIGKGHNLLLNFIKSNHITINSF